MTEPGICPFCDEEQSYRYILEMEKVRVVYPKDPACAFHVLITPKRHVQFLDQLTTSEHEQISVLLRLLAVEARRRLGESFIGYNVLSNNGTALVNQRVKHCHVHVLLRTTDDDELDLLSSRHKDRPTELTTTQLTNMAELQSWFS